jgi:hypothetical protein
MTARALPFLLILTVLHGLIYVVIVHPWQAPDEYLHYEYLRLVDAQRTLSLTANDRSSALQWAIEESMVVFRHNQFRLLPTLPEDQFRKIPFPLGSTNFTPQPPLYYLISLPLYWSVSAWPVLDQLYVLRVYSVLLQTLNVWLTYQLAKLIFSESPSALAFGAAAVVALLPQYTFISASYNNDNLAPPLVTGSLFALIKGLKRADLRWWAIALACGGLSVASKRTAIGIVPVLGLGSLAYGILWLRSNTSWLRGAGALVFVLLGTCFIGLVAVLQSFVILPPNLLGTFRLNSNAINLLSDYWRTPANLASVDWNTPFHFALESFWGQFGWLTIRLDPAVVGVMGWVTWMLALGCVVGLVRSFLVPRKVEALKIFALSTLFAGMLFTGLAMAAQYLVAPAVYNPQGRYFFPFISAFAILAIWGWRSWWPRQWQSLGVLSALGLLVIFDGISSLAIISFFYS